MRRKKQSPSDKLRTLPRWLRMMTNPVFLIGRRSAQAREEIASVYCRQCRRSMSFALFFVAFIVVVVLGTVLAEKVFGAAAADERPDSIRLFPAKADDHGILTHRIESPFQTGPTEIRVLLPKAARAMRGKLAKRWPVVYILPVEAGRASRYGDGLTEVQKHDLHNKHGAIFVAPTFSALPWYADHPSNDAVRQESHFLKAVLPLVEKHYPAKRERAGRLLVGFSKSGWGAWSLLLRHPKDFGRAAAWDAPLMMQRVGKYGNRPIFATQDNFDRYRPDRLLRRQAAELRGERRLILTGYGNFREHHQRAHELLEKLRIEHVFRDGPQRRHHFSSGWLPEAVELLFAAKPIGQSAP